MKEKKSEAGALARENGSAGFHARFHARFSFSLFPAPARFFPSVQSRRDCRRPLRRREVQRLAAEPDNKQTYRPVQPRKFVSFEFSELTLNNLKKASGAHFNLPPSTRDVLVSNKGPSCTNINQIPHRKDKV